MNQVCEICNRALGSVYRLGVGRDLGGVEGGHRRDLRSVHVARTFRRWGPQRASEWVGPPGRESVVDGWRRRWAIGRRGGCRWGRPSPVEQEEGNRVFGGKAAVGVSARGSQARLHRQHEMRMCDEKSMRCDANRVGPVAGPAPQFGCSVLVLICFLFTHNTH